MKILLFADLHQFEQEKIVLISEDGFDSIVFLGDIKASTIMYIINCFPGKKIYVMLGNHDDRNVFVSVNQQQKINEEFFGEKREKINNINLKRITIDGISFVGIEGSNKYKESMIGYTEKEAEKLDIPAPVDILLSHDSGYHDMKEYKMDDAHTGMKKISEYRKKEKPKFHIFGHFHVNCHFEKDDVKCFCIYGSAIFNTENGTINQIFD